MDWDDLRIFLAVARTETIARAAPALGIDASTAGRRLKRLETSLGQVLFERSDGRQRLTGAGKELLGKVEKMESLLGSASDQGDATQVKGLVRLSVSEGFGSWCIGPLLSEFAQESPEVTVEMVITNGFLSPSKRETDIAILLARPRKGPLITRRLTDYSLGLFSTRAYLDRSPALTDTDDLAAHVLIGYVPDFVYAPELDYLDEIAPGLEARIRSSSINAQYKMTREGGGIAVLPFFIGYSDHRLVRILPHVRIERSFWLVTHQDTRNLPRIKAIVRCINEAFSNGKSHLLKEQGYPQALPLQQMTPERLRALPAIETSRSPERARALPQE